MAAAEQDKQVLAAYQRILEREGSGERLADPKWLERAWERAQEFRK